MDFAAVAPDHGFVNEIIMLPKFGQAAVMLIVTIPIVASGPVPQSSGFLSPPSPPGLERTGPFVCVA